MAQKKTNSPIVGLAGLGILAIMLSFGWKGLQMASSKINELPIHGAVTVQQAKIEVAKTDSLKTLSLLLIEGKKDSAQAEATGSSTEALDKAFSLQTQKPVEVPASTTAAPAEQTVDFFPMLKDQLRLDAIFLSNSSKAAVINGKHYTLKDPLPEFSFPDKVGKMTIPVLARITESEVSIKDSATGRSFSLKLPE